MVFTTFYFGRGSSRAEEWNDQEQFIIFPSERKAAPPSVAVPPGAEEIIDANSSCEQEKCLLARERLCARTNNEIRRKLVGYIDAVLEDGGASGTTRRPLIIALDEAIEKYLEEMSSDVMEELRGPPSRCCR